MKFLQGNIAISIFLLRMIGFLGAILGIFAHFNTWYTIISPPKDVIGTGLQDLGYIGIALLIFYLVLMLINSGYSILIAVVFMAYMLEQVIGTHLLRYMPLSTTKLSISLYLYLPLSSFLIVLGSFASIISQIIAYKNK